MAKSNKGSGVNYVDEISYNGISSPTNLTARVPERNPAPTPNYARYERMAQRGMAAPQAARTGGQVPEPGGQDMASRVLNLRYTPKAFTWADEQYATYIDRMSSGMYDPETGEISDLLTKQEREYFGSGGALGLDPQRDDPYPLRAQITSRLPIQTTESRAGWLSENAPAAFEAVSRAGFKPEDVATVTNVYVAREAANKSIAYANAGEMQAAGQIVGALPLQQRIMAIAFVQAEQEKMQQEAAKTKSEEAAAAAERAKPVVVDGAPTRSEALADWGREKLAGNTQGPAVEEGGNVLTALLDGLLWGVEQVTHVARAAMINHGMFLDDQEQFRARTTEVGGAPPSNDMSFADRMARVWEASSEGFITQERADELSAQYGKKNVDTMIAYYEATLSESPTAMQEFFASIDTDEEAVALVTSAQRGENVGGDKSNGAELFVEVAGSDQGNYGNLVAERLGLDPDQLGFMLARDAANVTSWFAFDPLIFGGKILKAYKISKYGLARVMAKNGGSMAKAVATDPATRRAFDRFGESIKRIADATDPKEIDRLQDIHKRQFTRRESRFFNDVHTEVGLKKGLYTAEDWAEFYSKLDDVEKITKGQAVSMPAQPWIKGERARKAMGRKQQTTVRRGKDTVEDVPPQPNDAFEAARVWDQHQVAQGANRYLYVPHMTMARGAVQSMTKNMTFNFTRAQLAATETMAKVLGDDWQSKSREEQLDAIARGLADEETATRLGVEWSDFQAMSEGGKRTWVARNIMDPLFGGPANKGRPGRYGTWARQEVDKDGNVRSTWQKGWARKRIWNSDTSLGETFSRVSEQFRARMTVVPDVRNGVATANAKDADVIYQMGMAAGIGHDAAGALRSFWIEANEGQRQLALTGIVRTYLRASGVHVVDPQAEREIMALMSGVREGEQYAASHIWRYGGTMRDLAKGAQSKRDELAQQAEARLAQDPALAAAKAAEERWAAAKAAGKNIDPAERAAAKQSVLEARKAASAARREAYRGVPSSEQIRQGMVAEARKPGGPLDDRVRVDQTKSGRAAAVYPGQMASRMFVPNFMVLDRYMARTSMLNALLFNNKVGSSVTNLWVLGTLAGPRFQLRNGFEDITMHFLTGGKVSSWIRGRRMDQAVTEAVARESVDVAAKAAAKEKADAKLARLLVKRREGAATQEQVDIAQRVADEAKTSLENAMESFGQHGKLGMVRTPIVNLSEKITYDAAGHERDNIVSRVAQFLVPTTSKAERRAAANLGRDAVVEVAAKALMRQKLAASADPKLRAFGRRIARAKSMDELTAEDKLILKWETQLLKSEHGMTFKDESAEAAQHLSDATLPSLDDMGSYTYLNGELYRAVYLDKSFITDPALMQRTLTEKQARAMMASLQFMTERYSITQRAMFHLPEYWKAMNREGSMDAATMDRIVKMTVAEAKQSKDWPYLRETMRLMNADPKKAALKEEAAVRSILDDMTGMFTTRKGEWNQDLWRALRREDDKKRPYFTLGEGDDQTVDMLHLMEGKFEHPESILVYKSDPMWVPANGKVEFGTKAWEMMGRSLARMTRNPLYYGNYMEARKQLAPLEKKYARIFGEEQAAKLITDTAAERAYNLTMSYVDNPVIRTNLAWQVRNVARYYRAQEDFFRRMIRMAKYEPMGYWKATLAWQATQDLGFVHKDQYGDEYFIYPGTAPLMAALQTLGVSTKYGSAPMAFGGKVQWLSPSMDPNQWMFTASSPWTAVTLQPLLRSMPVAKDLFKSIERWVFGEIASQQDLDTPFGDVGDNYLGSIYGALPPAFKKIQGILASAISGDAPGTFGYKMVMKTVAAMASAGQMPSPEEWADKKVRDEFMDTMQARTVEMSFLSLLFGFVAPSSPQYMDDNVSIAARAAGYESLRPAFRTMIEGSLANGDSWVDAYLRWTKDNPNNGIWAQSQSAGYENGYVSATLKNVEYLKANEDVWKDSPRGMALFMPEGKNAPTSQAAFQALRTYNATAWKGVEQYATDMVGMDAYWDYLAVDSKFESETKNMQPVLGDGTTNPDYTRALEIRSQARAMIKHENRGLDYKMYGDGWPVGSEYLVAAKEVVDAARVLAERGNVGAQEALPLIDAYQTAQVEYDKLMKGQLPADVSLSDAKSALQDQWNAAVTIWLDGAKYLSTDQQRSLVTVLTRSIPESGSWEPVEVQ